MYRGTWHYLDASNLIYIPSKTSHAPKSHYTTILLECHLFYPGLDRSIFGSGQPYHRDWTEMSQDQSDLPRIRTWVRQALRLRTLPSWYFWLWPVIPLNYARRGHHSRNGPGPEWPPQDSNLGPAGLKA